MQTTGEWQFSGKFDGADGIFLPRGSSMPDGPMENELVWLADNGRLPAFGDTQLTRGGLSFNRLDKLIQVHAVFDRSDAGLMKWKAHKKTA